MKRITLTIAYLTVTGAFVLLLNSPFADDSAFTSLLFDARPPTLTIQQSDESTTLTNAPDRIMLSGHLTDIRIVQP